MAYTTSDTNAEFDLNQESLQPEDVGAKDEGSGHADGKLHPVDHDSPAGEPWTSSITSVPEGTEVIRDDVPDAALLVQSGPRSRPDVLQGNDGAVQANFQVEAMPAEIVLDERYDRLLYSDNSVAHVLKGEDDPRPERTLVERTPGGTRPPQKPEGVSVVDDPKVAEKLEEKAEKDAAKLEEKISKAQDKADEKATKEAEKANKADPTPATPDDAKVSTLAARTAAANKADDKAAKAKK